MTRTARRRSSSKVLMDIRTVAERANVSIATVSRTINRIPTVNHRHVARHYSSAHIHSDVPGRPGQGSGHSAARPR